MKLDKILDNYQFYTGKTSELLRQLSLAGIAIIWIFRIDKAGSSAIPKSLLLPTVILMAALFLDFLQYFYGGISYDIAYRVCECKKKKEHADAERDFKMPSPMLWPMDVAFYVKAICVLAAYVFLAEDLFARLFS